MGSPVEYLVYVSANVGLVAIGGSLAGLSFLAYWNDSGQRSYALAALGFGFVVLGGLSELLFTVLFSPDFILTRTEFLSLQAGEDVLIAVGLGLLFYAITQHETGAPSEADSATLAAEGDAWMPGEPYDD